MKDYRKIAEEALKKSQQNTKRLDESVVYPDGLNERMHPTLEDELLNQKTSLGKHPIFPEGDESSFEQKIMGKRFNEVAKRYKRAHEVDDIRKEDVMSGMMPLLKETMTLEKKHVTELEELAVKMIREEYDMDEDVVEIHAELTPRINMIGTKKNPTPVVSEVEFKNHDEMVNANEEVYKRRFLNAMTQGAAKKCSHMFHMVDDELSDIDPRLASRYAKLMSSADYMYYVIPKMEEGVNGGVVRVEFPTKDNPKAIIYAQAMAFPVLIHELVKGVMELLSAHGLPKDKKIGKFVIDKADFLAAEPWDMRIGPALWDRFTESIESDDFHYKHHVYSELAALPVREFNVKMREIMAGTQEGKNIVKNIIDEVKSCIQEEEYNEAMVYTQTEDGFSFDDLIKGEDDDDDDNLTDDGFDFDELF
jgi:hypothetical protein